MNWKKVSDIVFFIGVWSLAIVLIEYQGEFWLDLAGDLFGAMGLMFLAAERALRDDESPQTDVTKN